MESAYSSAMRHLAHIREENRAELERRLSRLRSESPRYAEIESRLAACGAALAKCVLKGGDGLDDIKAAVQKLQSDKAELLRAFNLPEDYTDEIYSCSKCRDTGFDDDGHRCDCLRRLISEAVSASSNLTEHMREQTFKKFDFSLFASQPDENGRNPLHHIKRAYETALQFAETFDQTHANLLFTGGAGTGKTYLSSCIANYALERNKSVYYQSAFRLFDMLEKLKFGRCSEDEQTAAEAAYTCVTDSDLLIIDDLGTEFISAYSTAVLFDIINRRLMERKSTVLSTNLNLESLKQIYSQRFTSRLWGSFEIIPFIGQDLRMNIKSPQK